jgi:hypothetical protein
MVTKHPKSVSGLGRSKKRFGKPVGGGSKSSRSNSTYLTPDYCLGCTYFQQSSGHFGNCGIINNKIYDGSKKGTGCSCWRLKSSLYPLLEKGQKEPEYSPSLRKIYNKSVRKKININPYRLIEEVGVYSSMIHSKNGYYKHRYNFKIIDAVLTLFLRGEDISKKLEEMHYRVPDRTTIREWIIKFLGKNCWDRGRESVKCIHCTSTNTVKNGYPRMRCRDCKKDFVIGKLYITHYSHTN